MKKAYLKWLKDHHWVSAAMARFGELAFAAGIAHQKAKAKKARR